MATEQQYDEIVGPMLLQVADKCKELGMSLVARVDWEPGEGGITQVEPKFSAGQMITYYAAHSHGNIDNMLLSLCRNEDVSASVYLAQYGVKK